MASGLPNKERVRIRQLYAEGKVDRMALLESEAASYHAPGTCTTERRTPTRWWSNLWKHAAAGLVLCPSGCSAAGSADRRRRAPVTRMTGNGNEWMPLGKMFDEKVVVNGIVALLATGGSTNHTMHTVAMARAAELSLTGTISPTCQTWCRCWRASIPTARRISTTSGRQAAFRYWCASC